MEHKEWHYGAQSKALRCTKQGIKKGITEHKARHHGAQSKESRSTKQGIMEHK